jgi:hypothetical protein
MKPQAWSEGPKTVSMPNPSIPRDTYGRAMRIVENTKTDVTCLTMNLVTSGQFHEITAPAHPHARMSIWNMKLNL